MLINGKLGSLLRKMVFQLRRDIGKSRRKLEEKEGGSKEVGSRGVRKINVLG
jgi:hypothetical protein